MLVDVKKNKRFFMASVALLFFSFSVNLLSAVSTSGFLYNFKDSEALVVNQVACKGQALGDQLLELKAIRTENTQQNCDPTGLKPYSSQYGLQGKLYTLGYRVSSKLFNIKLRSYVALAQLLTALLSAIVLGILVLWTKIKFGAIPAWVTALLIAMSPMIVGFARNLYWALPLLLAPFVYVLYSYDVRTPKKKKIVFGVILFVLFYVRYLCGYEYITTITIMVMAGAVYHLAIAKSSTKTYMKELGLIFIISAVAFGAALGTHIYSLQKYTGSTRQAISIVKSRALARTSDVGDYLDYPIKGLKANLNDYYMTSNTYFNFDGHSPNHSLFWATLASVMNYVLIPVVNIPIALSQPFATYAQSTLVFVVVLSLLYIKRRKMFPKKLNREVVALFYATALGFLGYLSWFVIARSHSLVHAHINGILLYLPFALFGYMIIGLFVQSTVSAFLKVGKK